MALARVTDRVRFSSPGFSLSFAFVVSSALAEEREFGLFSQKKQKKQNIVWLRGSAALGANREARGVFSRRRMFETL